MAVQFKSNLGIVLKATKEQLERAAEIIGGKAEIHAKEYCPVDSGTLRNSITHTSDNDGRTVIIGTNVDYAIYVELGTGVYAEKGNGRKTPWSYQDSKGEWHTTIGMKPHPYLRPAIENHKDEYIDVVMKELKG